MLNAILLPIDLSHTDGARRAISVAVEMAQAHRAVLHVMTVVPSFGMSIVGSYFEKDFEKRALTDAEAQLRSFCEQAIPAGIETHPHVAHGAIYDEIIRGADKLGCDTIVMAAHRPELRDYLLGPNAARVVRHAKQSVFVIRD
ncbi:MAG: universal stress protein [Pseudomonadota bacterium]